MRKYLAIALASSALFAAAPASAALVNVNGIEFDTSFINLIAGTVFETQPLAVGDELSGVGRISTIEDDADGNPVVWSNGQNGVELTFRFRDYILASATPSVGGVDFGFTGGVIEVYVDTGMNFDASDINTATDGDLFLTLVGTPDTAGFTLAGTVFGSLAAIAAGSGSGLLSVGEVDGNFGIANEYFDTNGQLNGSDLALNSSFSQARPGAPFPVSGSVDLRGQPQEVPEPAMIGLLGAGLAALGVARRRKAA